MRPGWDTSVARKAIRVCKPTLQTAVADRQNVAVYRMLIDVGRVQEEG